MSQPAIIDDVIRDLARDEGLDALQHLLDTYRNRRPERESDDLEFNVHIVRFDYINGTASFGSIIASPDEEDEVLPLDDAIRRIEAALVARPSR